MTRETSIKDESGTNRIQIKDRGDRLVIEIDRELFTAYYYRDVPRPYLYPVIGPSGDPVIRHWPMKKGKHEEHDHLHHRSLWFTHGEVNGEDFWSEGKTAAKIVHRNFETINSGNEQANIVANNDWVGFEGNVVCTETRTVSFLEQSDSRCIDFDITIHASHGPVTFGDTKEGSMAIRLAPTMRLKGKVGQGHIVNSEGVRDEQTWGKRSAWCDYYGPVNDQMVGVAIFDHPNNPRHPTWWHVRDYDLFAANPFGVHDFEKKPAARAT